MPEDTLRQGTTDTMVIRTSTADSGGDVLEVEATYAPMTNLSPPPMHYHPKQDEHFRVLDGALSVLVDGAARTLLAGDGLAVGRGVRHTMWNAGPDDVRFRWRTTPALRTETMFRTMWGLADDGTMGRHGNPRPPLLQSDGAHLGLPQRMAPHHAAVCPDAATVRRAVPTREAPRLPRRLPPARVLIGVAGSAWLTGR